MCGLLPPPLIDITGCLLAQDADLGGLLAERENCERSSDYCQDCENRGGNGGDLCCQQLRHAPAPLAARWLVPR